MKKGMISSPRMNVRKRKGAGPPTKISSNLWGEEWQNQNRCQDQGKREEKWGEVQRKGIRGKKRRQGDGA